MSYLVGNFYQNPPPPYGALVNPSNESFNTVPGWGVLPAAAGPAYLSVGQFEPPLTAAPPPADAPACPYEGTVWSQAAGRCVRVVSPPGEEPFEFPWWGWIVGAGVLGAGFALAVKKGWIG